MKKVVQIVVIVVLSAWALLATGLFVITRSANNEKYEKIHELESEIAELEQEAEGVSISEIRGIAYEYLFDALYYGDEFDFDAEIDKRVKQYDLDEMEKAEFLVMIDVLVSRYRLEVK